MRVSSTVCLAALLSALSAGPAATQAHAAGLAPLQVTSFLGQPLVAEAEITSLQPKEFESIIVRMAQEESFKAAKVNYSPLVRQVRIEPLKRADGTAVLRFTTVRAVNEPSLELLVDFNWPNGRLLQKYSILLDPAR